jgi:Icc-related predicted phosphoesterase
MTRFVCVSDTHTKHGDLVMPPGDVLLHAGDFTFNGGEGETRDFGRWLAGLPYRHKVIIPGNHDVNFERDWESASGMIWDHAPEVHILNQEMVQVAGWQIWGEPRQPWFFDWAYNVPRDRMGEECWNRVPAHTEILLTHGPPQGACDRNRDGNQVGCYHQRVMIERLQPRLVVCGHIHEGYGSTMIGETTLVANVSSCNSRYLPVNAPVVLTLSKRRKRIRT